MRRQDSSQSRKETDELVKELQKSRAALMSMLQDVEQSRKALMNILEDVDEARIKAEEEKNKTAAIINDLADGLLVVDNENNLSLINPQAEKILSLKKEEVLGKAISSLSSYKNATPLLDLFSKKTAKIFRKEVQLKENLIIEATAAPMIKEQKTLGFLVILHDVTREKMVEKMKTEFVSLAAHQLRTPLSAVKWTLRMLLDRELGDITADQLEFLEKSYQSNERMISLINDLLDVTRIEEGKYLYKPTLTSLGQLAQSVVNSYKAEIERRNIAFDLKKTEAPLPLVLIDVEKVSLVIQNLLDNALRYTPNGGQVTMALRYNKKEIEFSIKDTGLGIPQDQKSRVFSKFFRGTNVIRIDTEGSGLGLFIAKNIIEAHGGRIWFESEEGRGSTFYFSLPVKEEFKEFFKEL